MTDPSRDDEYIAFVDAAADRLHRYGYLLTGSSAEADDLVQETLMKLYLAWDRIEQTRAPMAYARTTMARTHVSRWRSLTRRQRLEDDVSLDRSQGASPRWQSDSSDRDAMWSALSTLGRRQRAVVVLRFYEELSEAEIAEALGISVGTVKSQLSRALATLRGRTTILELAGKETRS